MSVCCGSNKCEPTNKLFSKLSKRYVRRFRRSGLGKEQRLLLDGIRRNSFQEKRILDIGCGIGVLHLTLLKEGAANATGIDPAKGMIENARKLSKEFDLAEKTNYINGDFVSNAEQVKSAEITLLDKVVCCYDDLETLVKKSLDKTTTIYALTHPSENLFVKLFFKFQIAFAKIFRLKFHPFWHNWKNMREMIVREGFRCVYDTGTISWRVLIYQRV
jgi:magnesium-protoporphyrin O-methyltransferase